jgi:chemotaxis methyl-accepting protein methylase
MMPSTFRAGFDRDPGALAHARATVPRANFWEVDLTSPYWWVVEPSRPNVLLCVETLEHLNASDQLRLLSDFANVLRPAGVLVLACPIGNGPSERNPWHLYEPSLDELQAVLRDLFVRVDLHTEDYVSTSGPATQAFSVCYGA